MQTGNDPSAPTFGGMAGKVLREALSVAPFVSGLITVLGLAGLGFLLDQFEAVEARNVIFELALVVVLCRFAMNGYAGEWGGTVFSSRGGSWPRVGLVSVRFLALSSIWDGAGPPLGLAPGAGFPGRRRVPGRRARREDPLPDHAGGGPGRVLPAGVPHRLGGSRPLCGHRYPAHVAAPLPPPRERPLPGLCRLPGRAGDDDFSSASRLSRPWVF